ncbi:MAG TPA: hypothetical protein VEV38_10590, partial [Candidatus Eremiobacteraceae bacterium]|nr:hypothetical protein [Candidatus Eremiobacteraceae bacterium]
MHITLSPDDYAEIEMRLKPDGALRDLVVLETVIDDWQCLIDLIRAQQLPTIYREGDNPLSPPLSANEYFDSNPDSQTRLMSFQLAGMDLNCHFFTASEIEIDVDPRQVKGRPAIDSLLDFMVLLGRDIQKDVLLTDEGSMSRPFPFWEGVICSYHTLSKELRIGGEPRPVFLSASEKAAVERRDSWSRAFWSRLRLIVRGWGVDLDIGGTGDWRTVGSVQIWLLTSDDDDVFVVAGNPTPDRSNEWAAI